MKDPNFTIASAALLSAFRVLGLYANEVQGPNDRARTETRTGSMPLAIESRLRQQDYTSLPSLMLPHSHLFDHRIISKDLFSYKLVSAVLCSTWEREFVGIGSGAGVVSSISSLSMPNSCWGQLTPITWHQYDDLLVR